MACVESKLLRPGKQYQLGRKVKTPTQLFINNGKVSSDHGVFIVGNYSVDDVENPAARPTLSLFNSREKSTTVQRTETGQQTKFSVNPKAEEQLEDGDLIGVINDVFVSVHWEQIRCLYTDDARIESGVNVPVNDCAALGVCLLPAPSDVSTPITHHLTSTLSLSAPILTSLLTPNTVIVTPAWLLELLKVGLPSPGADPNQPTALERTYALPETTPYIPAFSSNLPEEVKSLGKAIWSYDACRAALFHSTHFLLLKFDRVTSSALRSGGDMKGFLEKTKPASFVEHLVDSGNAAGENELLIEAELRKTERVIEETIGRVAGSHGSICVVLSPPRITGEKEKLWAGILALLKKLSLSPITPDTIYEAFLRIDTQLVDSKTKFQLEDTTKALASVTSTSASPTPVSFADPPPASEIPTSSGRRPLRRRAAPSSVSNSLATAATSTLDEVSGAVTTASAVPPPTPAEDVDLEHEPISKPAPRKPLKRRAYPVSNTLVSDLILGVDDPSLTESQTPALSSTGDIEVQTSHTRTLNSSSSTTNTRPQFEIGVTGVPLRSKNLKRRRVPGSSTNTNAGSINNVTSDAEGDANSNFGPSLKKFKALFDSVDPDRLAMSGGISEGFLGELSEPAVETGMSLGINLDSQLDRSENPHETGEELSSNQVQSSSRTDTLSARTLQRRVASSGNTNTHLDSVLEKDEAEREDQGEASQVSHLLDRPSASTSAPSGPGNGKRKRLATSDTRSNSGSDSESTKRPAKRPSRQMSVAPDPGISPTNKPPGKPSNVPDTDPAFLAAIARRAAEHPIDEVDRDFANVRISGVPQPAPSPSKDSKPGPKKSHGTGKTQNANIAKDVPNEKQIQQRPGEGSDYTDLLASFGDDGHNVRGNFMLVVEFDVPPGGIRKRDINTYSRGFKRGDEGRVEWEGRMDFKKFRPKGGAGAAENNSRQVVELVLSSEGDFGTGSAYWKSSRRSQPRSQFSTQFPSQDHIRPRENSAPLSRSLLNTSTFSEFGDPHGVKEEDIDLNLTLGNARKPNRERHEEDFDDMPVNKTRSQANSRSRANSRAESIQPVAQSSRTRRSGSKQLSVPPPSTRSQASTKGRAKSSTQRSRTTTHKKSQPLFLDDSDDDEGDVSPNPDDVYQASPNENFQSQLAGIRETFEDDDEIDNFIDASQHPNNGRRRAEPTPTATLRSQAFDSFHAGDASQARPTRSSSRSVTRGLKDQAETERVRWSQPAVPVPPVDLVEDDDSDTGVTFGGFGGRRKGRK